MGYQFRTDIITNVPTCCLVEDIQMLREALTYPLPLEAQDLIQTVAECLEESIGRYTTVPDGLDITPSGSSLVAMSHKSGIIVNGEGKDILCLAGHPISAAQLECCGGTECLYANTGRCLPDEGRFCLQCGEEYQPNSTRDSSLLAALGEEVPPCEASESEQPRNQEPIN